LGNEKDLLQLFLGKNTLISPKTMQPNRSPEKKMAWAMGASFSDKCGQWSSAAWLYSSARLGLIFSSGRFIIKNYVIVVSLDREGMSPLQASQDDQQQGKISWKHHFPAKSSGFLLENCPGASTKALRQGLGGAPQSLGAG
jgi:hypothetical protein